MTIFPTIYFLLLALSTITSVNLAPNNAPVDNEIEPDNSDDLPEPEMDPALIKEEETIYIDAEEPSKTDSSDLPIPELDPPLIKEEATIDLDEWTE